MNIKNLIRKSVTEAMNSKTFEFHSGKEILKFVEKYPTYYFSTTTSPHSTIVEMSRTPKNGFYSASKIIKSAQNGEFD